MNWDAIKNVKFWVVLVLTNVGLVMASGLVTDAKWAAAVGWVVTMAAALGYRGWVAPPAPVEDTASLTMSGGKAP